MTPLAFKVSSSVLFDVKDILTTTGHQFLQKSTILYSVGPYSAQVDGQYINFDVVITTNNVSNYGLRLVVDTEIKTPWSFKLNFILIRYSDWKAVNRLRASSEYIAIPFCNGMGQTTTAVYDLSELRASADTIPALKLKGGAV